jgi:hypothetical protein
MKSVRILVLDRQVACQISAHARFGRSCPALSSRGFFGAGRRVSDDHEFTRLSVALADREVALRSLIGKHARAIRALLPIVEGLLWLLPVYTTRIILVRAVHR